MRTANAPRRGEDDGDENDARSRGRSGAKMDQSDAGADDAGSEMTVKMPGWRIGSVENAAHRAPGRAARAREARRATSEKKAEKKEERKAEFPFE